MQSLRAERRLGTGEILYKIILSMEGPPQTFSLHVLEYQYSGSCGKEEMGSYVYKEGS